ncbi:MAG TPA: DUF6262 family protein, partial [Mycobacterium sp.]|nr:DUF6262 family protein [Mycobacterium sp.]
PTIEARCSAPTINRKLAAVGSFYKFHQPMRPQTHRVPTMLADNSSHLRASARAKHETTRQRALEALARLEADNTPVTVTALAKAASVARSWIYTQPDLLERIATASERPIKPAPTRTTDESWQRRLQVAHRRIRALTEENKQLRTRLALAHGQRRAEQIASVRTLSTRQVP